jgi:hypothetical protein
MLSQRSQRRYHRFRQSYLLLWRRGSLQDSEHPRARPYLQNRSGQMGRNLIPATFQLAPEERISRANIREIPTCWARKGRPMR